MESGSSYCRGTGKVSSSSLVKWKDKPLFGILRSSMTGIENFVSFNTLPGMLSVPNNLELFVLVGIERTFYLPQILCSAQIVSKDFKSSPTQEPWTPKPSKLAEFL